MTTGPDNSRRRWFRFSLRSLFLLMFVIAVAICWPMYLVRKQGIAVAALEKVGCSVTGFYIRKSPTRLDRLRKLLGEARSGDASHVNARFSKLTDAEMAHLEALTELHCLWLDGTPVSDTGLAYVRGLTPLILLDLGGTKVTDAGMVQLRGLTHLGRLYLSQTQVTDAGLVPLRELTQLQILHLNGTRVTNAGVQQLQKALPKCWIDWQP